MATEEGPLSSVLDELAGTGREGTVSVGDVLDAFQHRSLGVLLTLFGLIATLPVIGGIPGISVLTGTLILVAVAQSFIGGDRLWMPQFVRRRGMSRERFDKGLKKARPWLRRVEHLLKPRLTVLVSGVASRRVAAVAAALLAVTFYPLAFVPYGVTAPAVGVLAFGLGFMACDGLLIAAGYAASTVTIYGIFTAL